MISRPDQSQHTPQSGDSRGEELAGLPGLIAEIVETMRKGNLESLEVSRGDFHLSITSRGRETPAAGSTGSSRQEAAPTNTDAGHADESEDVHTVTSPMIGTFYVAPAPGEPAFIEPGDVIEPDQVIGIVEAMKIMNEITADRGGRVLEVVAQDGQTVEYGSPLVRLSLDS